MPPTPQREDRADVPLIEDARQFHDELLRIGEVVGSDPISNHVVRVALNVQFLALKQSVTAANAVLVAIIPAEYGLRLSDEEDVVFQVNRPYASRHVANIKMKFYYKVERESVRSSDYPGWRVGFVSH